MINLLPPRQKKELSEETVFKTIVILGTAIALALVSFGLMLAAVKWYFAGQLDIKKIAVEQREGQLAIYSIKQEENRIADYAAAFGKLDAFYQKQTKTAELFDKFVNAMPAGFYLNSFSFQEGRVAVSGYCPDRDSLVNFQSNLESSGVFKNVYVPPGNWVMQKDINFNVTFDYVPNK